MKIPFSAAALLVLSTTAHAAAPPSVVTTLPVPRTHVSSLASHYTAVGDAVYFYAENAQNAPGLWRWSEADGATLVTALVSGRQTILTPIRMMAFGDRLLFSAHVDNRGTELWITDGTNAGTTLVKDIDAGGSSIPVPVIVSGDKAYFTADDPYSGRELWVTDGTPGGTSMVIDLTDGPASSSPGGFAAANGLVFFSAVNQLYVTDGTSAGTSMLMSGVSGGPLGVLNDRAYFLGADATSGRELWSTDGSAAGTEIVKDINPGAGSSWGGISTPFALHAGVLFFISETPATGRELWKTDGTEAGTQLVKDITVGPNSTQIDRLMASPAGAFFTVDDTDLWFSDGTTAGTIPVKEYPRIWAMVAGVNGAYIVKSAGNQFALEFSDGTVNGTALVTGAVPSSDHQLTATGGAVFFTGNDSTNGIEPWTTDGTAAGTHILANVNAVSAISSPTWMKAAGNLVYFAISDSLYRSDGTAAGTFAIGSSGSLYSNPRGAVVGDLFLYFGRSQTEPYGLWRTDGTVAGTQLVKAFSGINEIFATSHGYALIIARESGYGDYALWRTDGTEAGTTRILARPASNLTELAGRVYFIGARSYYPYEGDLWETGGTEASTRMVAKGIFTSLTGAGGLLYAIGTTSATGAELWKSDGTGDGTSMVEDIRPGDDSSMQGFLGASKHLVFFITVNESYVRELWRSDGTTAGTFALKTLSSAHVSSFWSVVSPDAAPANYFYFSGSDGIHGRELWRSDGTVEGTTLLTDVPGSSYIGIGAADVDGTLMFGGYDARGYELWETDGTPAGTALAADLIPGAPSSNPGNLTTAGEQMFFITGADARLWTMARAASRFVVRAARAAEGADPSTIVFTVTRNGSTAGVATVDFATSDLSAVAGGDYTAASGTLVFADGQATRQIAIDVLNDAVAEGNESFALQLSGSTGAAIAQSHAVGIIEDDDRRVALSIEYLPGASGSYYYWEPSRTFRITNAGPSGATVSLRVSESPYEAKFSCDGANPSVCSPGFVPAGGSLEFTVFRNGSSYATPGTGIVPGRTLTATVSAVEEEENRSDNTVTRMITADGRIALPAFLLSGSSATAQVRPQTLPSTVRLALTGGIVVSPSSVFATSAQPTASFALTVAPNAWGWSTVSANDQSTPLMRVPIVLPGETPLLDTTIIRPDSYSYFDQDEPITLPVTVAAVLHDGTRPGGVVSLLNASDGAMVRQQVLNAEAKATFTLTNLPVGSYTYQVSYGGDQYFNGATVNLGTIYVQGISTSTTLVFVSRPCGNSDMTAIVTSANGSTPTGKVRFRINYSQIAELPLVPTATPGEARASLTTSATFSAYGTNVDVSYIPDSPFSASGDYEYAYSGTCPAPTLIASATSASSVSLVWSDIGADLYDVMRAGAPSPGTFTSLGTTAASNFVDTTVAPGTSYIYKIVAKTSGGATRSTSAGDLATTVIFTDDPIAFRVTRIRATHIIQLRLAANAVRALAGQSPLTFGSVAAGSPIRASDLTELRTAIGNALVAIGQSPVTWVDAINPGGMVKTMHVQQMRNVVK